jgi:solute carrier family 35 protein F1/2
MSVSNDDSHDSKKHDLNDVERLDSPEAKQDPSKRPPILYSSPAAFFQSFGERWKSVWTRRFALALLCGQVVSLCITCTNITTTELVMRNWALPTTQSFFL